MVEIIAVLSCSVIVGCSVTLLASTLGSRKYFLTGWRWKFFEIAETASAWLLGVTFLCGGMSKLMPFPGWIGPVWLEEQLAEYGLGFYGRFIAWSEAIIGLLLLAKPTRVLGGITMVPLLLNIFMVTVSLEWRGTPWIISVFISINGYLLAFHFTRWLPLINYRLVQNFSLRLIRGFRARAGLVALIVLILSGPVLFRLAPVLSVVVIVGSLIGLFAGEFALAFPRPIENEPERLQAEPETPETRSRTSQE